VAGIRLFNQVYELWYDPLGKAKQERKIDNDLLEDYLIKKDDSVKSPNKRDEIIILNKHC